MSGWKAINGWRSSWPNAGRYSQGSFDNPGDPVEPLRRTFEQAIGGERYLALLAGANHFSFIHPHDETTGRGFLDWPAEGDAAAMRALLGELVREFIAAHVMGDPQARAALAERLAWTDERIALSLCK